MAMGASTQGSLMPCLHLPGLRFACTRTFRIFNYRQSTRKWSSSIQRHPLMVSKAGFVRNKHPLMALEAKMTRSIHPLMACETKKASNVHPLMAREAKIASRSLPLMTGEARIASNNCQIMDHEASNRKEIVAIDGYREGNLRQVRHISTSHRCQKAYRRENAAYSRVSVRVSECRGLADRVLTCGQFEHHNKNSKLENESEFRQKTWFLQANDTATATAITRLPERRSYLSYRNSSTQGAYFQRPIHEADGSGFTVSFWNKDVSGWDASESQATRKLASEQSLKKHYEGLIPSSKAEYSYQERTNGEFTTEKRRTYRAQNFARGVRDKKPSLQYNADYRGESISKECLHLPGIEMQSTQSRRLGVPTHFQDLNSHENDVKGFAVTNKSNIHSSWQPEIEKFRTIRNAATRLAEISRRNPASGTAETSSQINISHTSPASGVEGISLVSKTEQNGEGKASSESNSAQEEELEHRGDSKVDLSRQVESKEKAEHHQDTGSTEYIDNGTYAGGIFEEIVQEQPEKLLSKSEDKNEKGKKSYGSIWEDRKEISVTNGRLIRPNNSEVSVCNQVVTGITDNKETLINSNFTRPTNGALSISDEAATGVTECKGDDVNDKLDRLYNQIFIVDKVETAKMVVCKLMGEYRNLVHACDTEVADIDVKKESPVGHGKVICFSIYCGSEANFSEGKSCVWVDVLDGGEDVLSVFAPYFEDSSIRKVFHNYSFDGHIIGNHGIKVGGFYADTMHLARLWNSSRREEGGYSLEALTMDPKVMNGIGVAGKDELIEGKVSMKTLFGKRKIKKDGTEGKTITVAPVEELQKTERMPWICYSALDSISTWRLWKSLQKKLKDTVWVFQGDSKRTMYDFYEEYWRPFGELLVQMESKGMLVDGEYLSKMEEVAIIEQENSVSQFQNWASTYCPDAKYMNVGSDTQIRQLLFGGMPNKKDPTVKLPQERTMKVPNVDNFIEEGKKVPGKFRNIVLRGIGVSMEVDKYTGSGWPTVSSAALKVLAGKVSIDYSYLEEEDENTYTEDVDDASPMLNSSGIEIGGKITERKVKADPSVYGTAYSAFGGGKRGRDACHAIAALCEVSSINTLISNFLQPLQGKQISGKDGRVHCSLNINTETGRLSARKPNLQNQPALEKDRYKIRQAFIANPGNSLIVADYGQLELRILAHLSNCKSMLDAFKAGGDFHSRTAMNMYAHVRDAVEKKNVLLEWDPQPGEEKPPIPLLKDVFAAERRKAKMLNFSIAYGKTAVGLSKDWKVTLEEAKETVKLWYNQRQEVLRWQEERKHEAQTKQCVYTLLGRPRHLPCMKSASFGKKGHIERAAINTPVQGSAADVAMCAMLEISRNARLKELGWTLVLQVHDEMILEGPTETAEEAKSLVVDCMSYPFYGKNILRVDLAVDAKYASNWYAAK